MDTCGRSVLGMVFATSLRMPANPARSAARARLVALTHLKLDNLPADVGGLAIFGVFRRHILRGKSERRN
eukprot:1195927-Prorocentrum_minimum.AAC.3